MTGSLLSTDRRLLCEGWLEEWADGEDHLVSTPSVAYVVQDDRVWFAKGDATQLGESLDTLLESDGATRTIVESADDLDLEERRLPDGTVAKLPKGAWYVEGVFQRSGVRNANKRVYPRGIWERLIGDKESYAQKNIRERAMLGHLEHPKDGRTDGKEGAIVVTEAKLQPDGTVWGKAEILDTPSGLILKEYTRKNVRWGVSSRGNGTVSNDGKVDETNYVLETWDAVMKPSVPGAYPTMKGAGKVSEDLDEAKLPIDSVWLYKGKKVRVIGSDRDPKADVHVVYLDNPDKDAFATRKELKKLKEHDSGEPESQVTEAETFVSEVNSLIETPLDDIDNPMFRAQMRQQIRSAMERGTTLYGEGQGALDAQTVLDLQTKLTRYSLQLSESEGDGVDRAIDDAIRAATEMGESDRVDGFTRVTSSLRERLADALAEAETLRERLGEAESRGDRAEEQLDAVLEQLSEVEGKLVSSESQLKLAEDLLATRPSALRSEAVSAAVQEVCSEVPGLKRYQDMLELARDAGHVEQMAERLLPLVVRREPATEPVEESETPRGGQETRPTLPLSIIVESLDEAPPSPQLVAERTRPREVSIAAQAAQQMMKRV